VIHTDLIGGEPLLHPDIFPLMRHVVHSGMSTGMTTNGFLLTEDKLDALIDLGMGRIQISIDGLNPSPETPSRCEPCATRSTWSRAGGCGSTWRRCYVLKRWTK